MLRPSTTDPNILNERREQDKVFGLLLTLHPTFNDMVKHILRSDKLPSLEEVCSQIQKEQGSHDLFEGKESLSLANQAAASPQSHKVYYKKEEESGLNCEHCKRPGHTKEKCWDLHPHLKPSKFRWATAMEVQGTSSGSLVVSKPPKPFYMSLCVLYGSVVYLVLFLGQVKLLVLLNLGSVPWYKGCVHWSVFL